MTTSQELLDEEMGTPPPSTVDINWVIARQHRRLRRQRAGTVAGACALLLAMGAVPALLLRTAAMSPRPGQSAASAPGATSSMSARERESLRLSAVLRTLLAADLPHAQIETTAFNDGGTDFWVRSTIRDDQGTGEIYVHVGRVGPCTGGLRSGSLPGYHCLEPTPVPGHVVPCPGGVQLSNPPGIDCLVPPRTTADNLKHAMADVVRTDGRTVFVDVTNGQKSGTDGHGGPGVEVPYPQRPDPPLTTEQAQALAENPELATALP
jgi:hypothetical protein